MGDKKECSVGLRRRRKNVNYDENSDDEEHQQTHFKRTRLHQKLLLINQHTHHQVQERKARSNDVESVPGSPPDLPMRVLLPDKKTLELVLDRLQKKDTYGVFAEPVDPDELPDYHDVIEHPMDFGTVRKKLGKRSYSTLEQFESDILLICSNAMQYNASDTVYHKQALSIQELAKRKFQSLRCGAEQCEKELQSEQKPTLLQSEQKPASLQSEKKPASLQSLKKPTLLQSEQKPASLQSEKKPASLQSLKKSASLQSDKKPASLQSEKNPASLQSEKKHALLQSEKKPASNSLGSNKHIKKPITRIASETVTSDSSAVATLATLGDSQPKSTTKASGSDRPSNVDESVDGTATPSDNKMDKAEDLPSGKGHRSGKKPVIHDDDHRATYNVVPQPVSRTESGFSTFDDETKQLVALGLQADHSYARSLARFAAMLGPTAWSVASKKIEQALPPGYKFGRGWVGDYEPISNPVLVIQKSNKTETHFRAESSVSSNPNKHMENLKNAESIFKNPKVKPTSQRESTLFGAAVNTTVAPTSYSLPSKPQPLGEEMLDAKPNIGGSVNYRVQSPRVKNNQPGKKVKKRVELNSLPSSPVPNPSEFSSAKQIPKGTTTMPGSHMMEPLSRDLNHQVSVPLKKPQNNGFVEVMNGKPPSNKSDIYRTSAPANNDRNATSMPANYFSHGHNQALTDPVQLMRRLSENTQNQQNPVKPSTTGNPLDPLMKKEDPSNASATAARAWMSIGAGSPKSVSENTSINNRNQISVNSLHSPTQVSRFRNDFPASGVQFHPMMNNFSMQGFMAPQFRSGNEAQFQNVPPMGFPQLGTTDLSRFQMQSSPHQAQHLQRWQPSQKQETTVPPDLNLVFQSSGSPGRQSSGLQADSQQPDLALQL